MDEIEASQLKQAVENMHGGTATLAQTVPIPAFRWANTMLANIKNSLLATHRVVGAKHLAGYLGAFAWRFNRRFVLKTIHERLAIAATTTPPMPYRLLKLAEARW